MQSSQTDLSYFLWLPPEQALNGLKEYFDGCTGEWLWEFATIPCIVWVWNSSFSTSFSLVSNNSLIAQFCWLGLFDNFGLLRSLPTTVSQATALIPWGLQPHLPPQPFLLLPPPSLSSSSRRNVITTFRWESTFSVFLLKSMLLASKACYQPLFLTSYLIICCIISTPMMSWLCVPRNTPYTGLLPSFIHTVFL